MFVPITYQNLLDLDYISYTWDSNEGPLGSFIYKTKNNNLIVKNIELKNISDLHNCSDLIISQNKILGLSKTTVKINNLSIGVPYGWSHEYNCWVYYNNNSDIPTHYSNYIE